MTKVITGLWYVIAFLSLSACATAPSQAVGPADYTAIDTQPHPRAALYADCIGQAVTARTYGHAQNDDSHLILFTCTGAAARAMYDGLAQRSATIGSEVVRDGRTYRSTNAVQRDLYGVDYCFADGAVTQCVISLNAGAFLDVTAD